MPQHNYLYTSDNQYGYSLVELMIVVAIIGILGTYARFNYSPANARLKQAARELYSSMQTAKIEAIKGNKNWGIICDNTTDTYAICAYSAGGCTGANTTLTLNDYGSGIKFGYGGATKNATTTGGACPENCPTDGISYNSPNNIAYFNSKGLSPSTGYIYLENSSNATFAIGTTSLAGVIKIRKWAKSTSTWE